MRGNGQVIPTGNVVLQQMSLSAAAFPIASARLAVVTKDIPPELSGMAAPSLFEGSQQ